ncbi:hypothetical protein D3C74_367070 [compost metagenome]
MLGFLIFDQHSTSKNFVINHLHSIIVEIGILLHVIIIKFKRDSFVIRCYVPVNILLTKLPVQRIHEKLIEKVMNVISSMFCFKSRIIKEVNETTENI